MPPACRYADSFVQDGQGSHRRIQANPDGSFSTFLSRPIAMTLGIMTIVVRHSRLQSRSCESDCRRSGHAGPAFPRVLHALPDAGRGGLRFVSNVLGSRADRLTRAFGTAVKLASSAATATDVTDANVAIIASVAKAAINANDGRYRATTVLNVRTTGFDFISKISAGSEV